MKSSCGWEYTYLYTSVHTSGYVFRLTRLERAFFSVVCIQALGIRLWEQAWSYWAECISCFSSWFLRSDELQCWNLCWKCCIRQNFVSLFMMFCYDCLRFPAVLVMLAMVVPSLDLCLILLWCRHVCVSFSAVVMPLLWLSMSMSWVPQCGAPWCSGHLLHASLTASYRQSPTDGSTANHWCDPNSVEVKANLSAGFPGLWAKHPAAILLCNKWGIRLESLMLFCKGLGSPIVICLQFYLLITV